MLNVGIIGCGNAGNQVCSECSKMYPDIPILAINCSEKDLSTLNSSISKFLIGDGRGAGKNREEAKEFLESSIMAMIENDNFRDFLKELDLVFIVSSIGGGTGSGISLALTEIIKEVAADKCFPISVGILPTVEEALATQENSLSYLTELYEVSEKPTYMLYDNEKYSKLPSMDMMNKINQEIVNDINVLRGYYNSSTRYNSIDERDSLTIITTPGRILVASLFDVKDEDINDNNIEDMFINEIKKNGHAKLQDDKIVNRTGIIINASKTILTGFDTHMPKVQEIVGSPVEEFEHMSINEDRKLPNNLFFIASGLKPINDRILKIKDRIDSILDAQRTKEEELELDDNLLTEIQGKRVYREKSNLQQNRQVDVGSILSKFKKKK